MGKPRKRTDGAGTVIARANGTFTAQITDATMGRRRSIGTFPTRVAADKALAAAIVEGAPPAVDTRLGEHLEQWAADRMLTVKPTTASKDRNLIRRYVLGHPIGRVKVRDLQPDHFRRLYRELREHGKADGTGLSASSVKTLDQTLKAALQALVDDRVLRHHPIPRRAIRVDRTERPWLNAEQLRELLRFVRFAVPDFEVVVRLGALAGFRRGEICGIRWTDVDLERGTITIRRNRVVANGHVTEHSPKTDGSAATVHLDEGTIAALRRHRERRAALIGQAVPAQEYVVCVASGAGADPNNVGRDFRRLVERYEAAHPGAPIPRGIGLHSLRHSFASVLVAGGVNLKVAATAMRHSSVRMMDRYSHLTPSAVEEAVRVVAAEVGA